MSDWPSPTGIYRYEATDGKDGIQDTTVDSDSKGVSITPNATAGVEGSYATLINGTRFEGSRLILWVSENVGGTRTADDYLIDIAFQIGGTEYIVITDLLYAVSGIGVTAMLDIPLRIPKGTVLRARCSCGTASGVAINVSAMVCGSTFLSGYGGVSTYDSLGVVAGDTGTQLDPGATVNTFGSVVEFSSSTSFNYKGFFLSFGNNANSAISPAHTNLIQVMVGPSTERVIVPMIRSDQDTGTDGPRPSFSPFFPVWIPSGTRISMKTQSNGNTSSDRLIRVVMHCAR